MSTLKQQITALLRVPITDLGYEYLGLEFIPNHACSLLRIYIDHQQGITVEDCAVVSRQISALLDVEDPINRPYQLEVSSPGLHRPLFTAAQYAKFLQHEVILVLDAIMHKKPAKTGQKQAQSRNQRRGIIKAVNGELITVEFNGKEEVFALSTIQEAKLVPHLKSLV